MMPVARERVPLGRAELWAALGRSGGQDDVDGLRAAVAAALDAKHVFALGSARLGLFWLFSEVVRRAGPGEALLWNYNFFAVPDMARRAGLDPVFVDSANDFGEPSEDAVRRAVTDRTRVLVVSHHFGRPSDGAAWSRLAAELGLLVVEDCAHAFGARIHGRSPGLSGLGGVFSLSLTKALTGVAGGLLITDDDDAAAQFREAERGLRPPSVSDVRSSVASALAGTLLLGRRSYGALVHLPNLVAQTLGFDPIDGLMTEPPPTDGAPAAAPELSLHPTYARLALSHLRSVDVEAEQRRAVARPLAEAPMPSGVRLAGWETDRYATCLNVVARCDDRAAVRRWLLRHGFDARPDYIRPMDQDSARFPHSTELTRTGLYLPVRNLDGDAGPLVACLTAFGSRA